MSTGETVGRREREEADMGAPAEGARDEMTEIDEAAELEEIADRVNQIVDRHSLERGGNLPIHGGCYDLGQATGRLMKAARALRAASWDRPIPGTLRPG